MAAARVSRRDDASAIGQGSSKTGAYWAQKGILPDSGLVALHIHAKVLGSEVIKSGPIL